MHRGVVPLMVRIMKGVVLLIVLCIAGKQRFVFVVVVFFQVVDVVEQQHAVFVSQADSALLDDVGQMFEEQKAQPSVDQLHLIDLLGVVLRVKQLSLQVRSMLHELDEIVGDVQVADDRRGKEMSGDVLGDDVNLFGQGLVVDEETRAHVALNVIHDCGIVELVVP